MIDANTIDSIDTDIFSTERDFRPGIRETVPPITESTAIHGVGGPPGRLRPFDRVVGQTAAVTFLRRFAEGISFGGEPDPILLLGPSGRGKTLLASEFAAALSMPFIAITCGREVTPAALVERIAGLADPAVLFLDEAHSLPKKSMELLFGAIDDVKLPALNNGRVDRTAPPVAIARHVWVAATNIPGGLLRALRARLVSISLADYSQDELEVIARQKTESLDIVLSPEGITVAAAACGGSPRALGHLLNTIAVMTVGWRYDRDLEGADATIPAAMAEEVIGLLGIDSQGLDATNRSLLATIARQPFGAASAEMLSVTSGLDLAFVRERLGELRGRGYVTASPGRGWTTLPRGTRP
jgi:Holliday junction resolvasome RuvABC ATP-dependent DNA helicase subunit